MFCNNVLLDIFIQYFSADFEASWKILQSIVLINFRVEFMETFIKDRKFVKEICILQTHNQICS